MLERGNVVTRNAGFEHSRKETRQDCENV